MRAGKLLTTRTRVSVLSRAGNLIFVQHDTHIDEDHDGDV